MIAPANEVNTSLDDWFVWEKEPQQRKSPPASRTKKETSSPRRSTSSSHNKKKVVPEEQPVNQNSQTIQQKINQEQEEERKQQLILNERIRVLLLDADQKNKNHKDEHRRHSHSHAHHQNKTNKKKHDHKPKKHDHPKEPSLTSSPSHHKTHHQSKTAMKKKRHSDHDASQTARNGAAERSHRRASDPAPSTSHQHHQDEDTSPALAMSPNSISIRKKKLMAIPSSPRDSPRYWSNHGAGTEEQRQDFPASPSSKTKSPSFVHKQALHSQIKRNSRLAPPVFPEHRHHSPSSSSKKKKLGTSVRRRRNSAPSFPTKFKVKPSQKRASAPANLPSSPDPPVDTNSKLDLRRDWSGELAAVVKIDDEPSATTSSGTTSEQHQHPPTRESFTSSTIRSSKYRMGRIETAYKVE